MLLAFLDDVVAVVAAEVGEPGLGDDGFAVGGGGFEVTFGDPSGDGLFANGRIGIIYNIPQSTAQVQRILKCY